jgi:hypothetical protein
MPTDIQEVQEYRKRTLRRVADFMVTKILSGTYNHAEKHAYFCDLPPDTAKALFFTQFKAYRAGNEPFKQLQGKGDTHQLLEADEGLS